MAATPNPRSSPGIEALLGKVRLRVAACEASFEIGDLHPASADVAPPGAVVGRGDDADLRLVGPAGESVSRRHLLIQPAGRQWAAIDCGSTHGTWEPDERAGWRRLPAGRPIPVSTGLLLALGPELRLRLEIERAPLAGATTDPRRGRSPHGAADRVRPHSLELVALALLRPRRADPRVHSVPEIGELIADLHLGKSSLYRAFRELRELPEISAQEPGRPTGELADALAAAFPYLRAGGGDE